MKRYLTLVLLFLGVAVANAQQDYKVSTGEQKKGVLIEEYTGIGCGFCPEGHEIASGIVAGSQGQAHVVNIHTGGLSPESGKFVLRTDDGDAIAANFPPKGFPSGMVNRHMFAQDKYVYGREDWRSLSNRLMKETAAVNLYGEAVYDGNTKTLSVHVEGYNPVDNSSKDVRINVMLTQDNIVGPQNGTSGNYSHKDVLRKCITPVSGDAVAHKGKGEYFSADYSWQVPDAIKEQKVELGNLNVVVFVTGDGMSEIENVTEFAPVYKNLHLDSNPELLAPAIPVGDYYGYNYFEAVVNNTSSEKASTATFNVTLNGVTEEITQDCSIDVFAKGSFTLPCKLDFGDKTSMNYAIELKRINNTDVNAAALSGTFERPQLVDGDIIVKIVTDKSANENDFLLKDQDGNVIKNFGPFANGKRNEKQEKIHLEKGGIYCVEIIDRGGNGMKYGNSGSLIVSTAKNELVDYIDNVPDNGTRVFFMVDTDLAVDGLTVEETDNGTAYTLSGIALGSGSKGERIVIKNGKKYIVK